MTMQEALDILMQDNSSGMSPEELSRRETLVRGLSTSNPELARQVASGPYQMNVGNSQLGDTATPQEGWQRGPVGGSSYSDQARSQPQQQAPRQGVATPSTTGPMVSGQPPSWMTGASKDYNGNSAGPFQGPQDRQGNVQGSQMPSITINLGGQPQANAQAPSWMTQAPPDQQGNGNMRGVLPGMAMSSTSNNNYPYSPTFPQSSMTPGDMGQATWNQAQQTPQWYEDFNPVIPPDRYSNGAYSNSNYPMSPMWTGR